MNYKDLMPDDLINTETDGYVRVTFATPTSVVYLGGICPIKQASPIPLTEDILAKNGFKKQEDVNEWSYYKSKDGKGQYMILWNMDYNYLEIGSYTGELGEFNRMGIMRYVHQLQHALRLCGIEKEIEL